MGSYQQAERLAWLSVILLLLLALWIGWGMPSQALVLRLCSYEWTRPLLKRYLSATYYLFRGVRWVLLQQRG